MSHNIDTTTGQAAIAFRGSRNDIWHRLGQEMPAGASIDDWAREAGLDWHAALVPALADLTAVPGLTDRGHVPVPGWNHLVRSDTGHPLGYVSDRYQPVQPRDVLDWFSRYISVDDRFQLDVAGALRQGEIIWATATFNGNMPVAGEAHTARLLMTTTFDGSGATINKATMTRVVCNNTLDVALYDKDAEIRTRHNTRFNPDKVAKELSAIAQGFTRYQALGNAMAQVEMSKEQISAFFKELLDIPFDAKASDISTRKRNQFDSLSQAYRTSVEEGAPRGSTWAALQAVTRYTDHDRSVKSGDVGETEARFTSAQFGTGARLKEEAMELLLKQDEVRRLLAKSDMGDSGAESRANTPENQAFLARVLSN